MYGIDKSTDFRFMIGKELLQLCIGLHQLIMNFSDQLVITAECLIRLTNPDGLSVEISADNHELSRELSCLLGSTIESVDSDNGEKLAIIFSNGYILAIIDSNEEEESFAITMVDEETVV